jgi:hypothetical protein
MSHSKIQPCNFCGVEEISNTKLSSDWMVRYEDGPARASVPGVILCYDCAQDVSDYFEARTMESNEDVVGRSPFGEEDAQALLNRLLENEHLVLEPGRAAGYGVRAVDGEWKRAVFRAPGPLTIETLTQDEVRDLILSAKRLTLKHLDPSAWERFERDR